MNIKRMSRIGSQATILASLVVAGMLVTGCNNNECKCNEILKPVADNILGKWNLEKSFSMNDDKWIEEPRPDGSGQTVTFRSDGSGIIAATVEGQTSLNVVKWSADDAKEELTMGSQNNSFKILSLNADSFEMSFNQAIGENGEMMDGEFKWLLIRMDETKKTLAEQLVGKWVFTKSYIKKDGEWEEITYGLPDEGWYLYRENGTYTVYSRSGDDEISADMNWSVNCETGELLWKDKETITAKVNVTIDESGNLNVFYTQNFDQGTGEIITGEFKDILVKE